jgi:hypothetical protein
MPKAKQLNVSRENRPGTQFLQGLARRSKESLAK